MIPNAREVKAALANDGLRTYNLEELNGKTIKRVHVPKTDSAARTRVTYLGIEFTDGTYLALSPDSINSGRASHLLSVYFNNGVRRRNIRTDRSDYSF